VREPGRAARHLAALVSAAAIAGVVVGCGNDGPAAPTPADPLDSVYLRARIEPNLKSLVVAHNGSIVGAEYMNGGGPDTPEHVWSVTKSVLALTVGAALDTGCLRSLDQTLGELLGPVLVTDPLKAGVTLRHLLTMSSGIDFPEAAYYASGPSLYGAWIGAPDQVAWVMARPITAQPGARFEYGSGTIHLASVALTRACGMSTSAFAGLHVFAPLGIAGRQWEVDHQGYNNGGAGLYLTPRDMLAVGEMVLDGGRYRDRQVVSSEWVQAMTRAQIATGPGSATETYGFAWWVGRTLAGDVFFLANGWGGQFICGVPAKRLIITTATSTVGMSGPSAMAQWQRIFDMVYSQIIPAY
jgi:CubicO group peptidase (beta-lactamase class C family)